MQREKLYDLVLLASEGDTLTIAPYLVCLRINNNRILNYKYLVGCPVLSLHKGLHPDRDIILAIWIEDYCIPAGIKNGGFTQADFFVAYHQNRCLTSGASIIG